MNCVLFLYCIGFVLCFVVLITFTFVLCALNLNEIVPLKVFLCHFLKLPIKKKNHRLKQGPFFNLLYNFF